MSYFLNGKDVHIYIDGKKIAGAEKLRLIHSRRLHKIRNCFCNQSAGTVDFGTDYIVRLENILFADNTQNLTSKHEIESEIDIVRGEKIYKCFSCLWAKREFEVHDNEVRENWEFICEKLEEDGDI